MCVAFVCTYVFQSSFHKSLVTTRLLHPARQTLGSRPCCASSVRDFSGFDGMQMSRACAQQGVNPWHTTWGLRDVAGVLESCACVVPLWSCVPLPWGRAFCCEGGCIWIASVEQPFQGCGSPCGVVGVLVACVVCCSKGSCALWCAPTLMLVCGCWPSS